MNYLENINQDYKIGDCCCLLCYDKGFIVWRLAIQNNQPIMYVISPLDRQKDQHPAKELTIERCSCNKGEIWAN